MTDCFALGQICRYAHLSGGQEALNFSRPLLSVCCLTSTHKNVHEQGTLEIKIWKLQGYLPSIIYHLPGGRGHHGKYTNNSYGRRILILGGMVQGRLVDMETMLYRDSGSSDHSLLPCHFQAAIFLNVSFFTCKIIGMTIS